MSLLQDNIGLVLIAGLLFFAVQTVRAGRQAFVTATPIERDLGAGDRIRGNTGLLSLLDIAREVHQWLRQDPRSNRVLLCRL